MKGMKVDKTKKQETRPGDSRPAHAYEITKWGRERISAEHAPILTNSGATCSTSQSSVSLDDLQGYTHS